MAESAVRKPTPFDPVAYPHLVGALLDIGCLDVLHALRTVCKEYKRRADARLVKEIEVPMYIDQDQWGDPLEGIRFRVYDNMEPTAGYSRRVAPLMSMSIFKSADEVPEHVRGVLGDIRVLRFAEAEGEGFNERPPVSRKAAKQLAGLFDSLSPFLTGLERVHLPGRKWVDRLPFSADTLALEPAFHYHGDGVVSMSPVPELQGPWKHVFFDVARYYGVWTPKWRTKKRHEMLDRTPPVYPPTVKHFTFAINCGMYDGVRTDVSMEYLFKSTFDMKRLLDPETRLTVHLSSAGQTFGHKDHRDFGRRYDDDSDSDLDVDPEDVEMDDGNEDWEDETSSEEEDSDEDSDDSDDSDDDGDEDDEDDEDAEDEGSNANGVGSIDGSSQAGSDNEFSDENSVAYRDIGEKRDDSNDEKIFRDAMEKYLKEQGLSDQQRRDIARRTKVDVSREEVETYPEFTRFEQKFDLNVVIAPETTAKMEQLEEAFLAQTGVFTSSGSISLVGALEGTMLYIKQQDSKGAEVFELPLDAASVEKVYSLGAPSPFGRGQELIYDASYREAHEIKPPHFSLSGDMLAQAGVLHTIEKTMNTGPLYATIAKLNVYAEGGFFKPHRDTPRGDNHLGTITMCLPSAFTGGQLVVKHGGETETIDWATTAGAGNAVVPWTFLYSDCEHEVLPVRSGMRVTVAYDVFVVPKGELALSHAAAPHSRASDQLRAALDDPDFLHEGGVLAFGLQHEYPKAPGQKSDFLSMLKGADAAWAAAISEAGLQFEFVAVYDEGVTPRYGEPTSVYNERMLAASRTFDDCEGQYIEEEDMQIQEIPVKNIHWVTVPGEWGMTNRYLAYGNDVSTHTVYVTVGIYAYVGPPGARTSFGPTTYEGVVAPCKWPTDDY